MPQEAFGKIPDDPAEYEFGRYSDEQLYALALYVYSLQPPPNPNQFDALAAAGQKIFEREGCTGCHTPPLYTNNQLTRARGFKIPPEHEKKFAVKNVCVNTNPDLALKTRRGTGYYKVPSLRHVWRAARWNTAAPWQRWKIGSIRSARRMIMCRPDLSGTA